MGWYDAVSLSAWSIFFGSIWTSIFSDTGIGQPIYNMTSNTSRPADLGDGGVVQRIGLLLAGRFLTGMGIGGMYPCAAILSLHFGPWGSVAERLVCGRGRGGGREREEEKREEEKRERSFMQEK